MISKALAAKLGVTYAAGTEGGGSPKLIGPPENREELGPELDWEGSAYQHEFLAPFKRDAERPDTDYRVRDKPQANAYWSVKPSDAQNVILRYQDKDKHPALLVRQIKSADG